MCSSILSRCALARHGLASLPPERVGMQGEDFDPVYAFALSRFYARMRVDWRAIVEKGRNTQSFVLELFTYVFSAEMWCNSACIYGLRDCFMHENFSSCQTSLATCTLYNT